MKRIALLLTTVTLAGLLTPSQAPAEDGHPYLLWTPAEAKALRKTIETQDWAKKAYADLPAITGRGDTLFPNLLRYVVMGDAKAGEHEKKLLLAGKGNAVAEALRYDCLYDLLTPAERKRVEDRLRKRVAGAQRTLRRQTWMNRHNVLPNLTYFWIWDTSLIPLALRDKDLAREFFRTPMSVKWYLDEYLSDSGFYNEEFSKMFVRAGSQLLWAQGCDRLGLPEIGWEYEGRKGATWRGHVGSVLRIGFPRVDLGTDRYHYPRMTMGDAKGSRGMPGYPFQHSLVKGRLTDGTPTRRDFYGDTHLPQWMWFEIAHRKFPDDGYDYFLAQMRPPGSDRYIPTLYFGLEPIDADDVTPPPAPSGVYDGRGLIMLRAEESRKYWEGPWPTVGMRLATPYAHHIQDCFSLTGFYAHNRPIFVNRQMSTNYSGVDPGYSNSPRSHSTVIVDFAPPRTIGEVATRKHFGKLAKFAAGRGKGIYRGVDQTRALVLTREYLLDAFRLASDRPRHYQWIIQTLGHPTPDEPERFAASRDLVGSLFDVSGERSLSTDETWAVTSVQTSGGAHPKFSGLGERWFTRRVGVRTTVLGEKGTGAYVARAPVVQDASGKWHGKDRFAHGADEPAGVTIAAIRKKPETVFVAVHEPFEKHAKIASVLEIHAEGDVRVVRIEGTDGDGRRFVDVVGVALGDSEDKEIEVPALSGTLRFTGYGFVRRTASERPVTEGGAVWSPDRKAWVRETTTPKPVVAAHWMGRDALCMPTGGKGSARLRLRNNGPADIDQAIVRVTAGGGVKVSPKRIDLGDFAAGAEKVVTIRFDTANATPNKLHTARLGPDSDKADYGVQSAALVLSAGVAHRRDQVWPADFEETLYAPRYIAKYYYMNSAGMALLLDPEGNRRSNSGGVPLPLIERPRTDEKGKTRWQDERITRFPYFVPVVVDEDPDDGEPALIYEAGRHAHGSRSQVAWWFTEDWVVLKLREGKRGERVAFNWWPGTRKNDLSDSIPGRRKDLERKLAPGTVRVMLADGTVVEGGDPDDRRRRFDVPKEARGKEIRAIFLRDHGYEYGKVMLYPEGTRIEKDRVTQPADRPMAFTFATLKEFPDVAGRWKKAPHSGEPTDRQRGTYSGAFMPHLIDPEDEE